MIHRSGDFEEWQLAEFMQANGYIETYARPGQTVVKIPYLDEPTGKKKYVEFQWFDGPGWVYTDNNQDEK